MLTLWIRKKGGIYSEVTMACTVIVVLEKNYHIDIFEIRKTVTYIINLHSHFITMWNWERNMPRFSKIITLTLAKIIVFCVVNDPTINIYVVTESECIRDTKSVLFSKIFLYFRTQNVTN